MGKKIGDYIHYQWSHYLKYGLGTPGHNDSEYSEGNISQIFKNHMNVIKSNTAELNKGVGKMKTKQDLEEALNFFKGDGTLSNFDYNEQDKKEIIDLITKYVLEYVEKHHGKLDTENLSKSQLRVSQSMGTNVINQRLQSRKDIGQKQSERKTTTTEDAIVQRIHEIETQIKKINENMSSRTLAQSVFLNAATILKDKYTELYEQFNSIAGGGRHTKVSFGHKGTNFIKELNNVFYLGKSHAKTKTTVQGGVAELIGMLGTYIIDEKANKSIDQIEETLTNMLKTKQGRIDLGWVGEIRSYAVLDSSNFAVQGVRGEKKDSHFLSGQYFTSFDSGQDLELHYTQDKVDCVLRLPGTDQKFNASIKNYNSLYNYHLLSGTSILGLTQEYTYFMNHYLNVTATHDKRHGGSPVSSIINLANQALILTIGAKALIGGRISAGKNKQVTKSQEAQLFIVNDSTGYFTVYFVDDIINMVVKNIDKNSIIINNLDENTTWPQKYFADKEGKSYNKAYMRINELLGKLNCFKLRVTMNPAILNNI